MKLQSVLIGVTAIACVMAFSNPSKERYIDYATDQFAEMGKSSFCSDANIPSLAQQSCKFMVSQGRRVIKPYIEGSTKQQNFILFSIYDTEMPNRKLMTIAAFGNFFTFK
jgi:hypothetical protein